ncbi:hypothetical protein ZWY2020_031443 [Hordeum vulgare]|nr:hypothetical protein ZWY2020_031443 [Hordeum vulgare]
MNQTNPASRSASLLSPQYTMAKINPINPASPPSTILPSETATSPTQSVEEKAAETLLMLAEAALVQEDFDLADEEYQSPVSSPASSNMEAGADEGVYPDTVREHRQRCRIRWSLGNAVILHSNVLEPYPGDLREEATIVAVNELAVTRKLEGAPSTVPATLVPDYQKPEAMMLH